jgi:uncharacterized protein YndB with AHSA1/START domain
MNRPVTSRTIAIAIVAASLTVVSVAAQRTDAIVTDGVVNASVDEVWKAWTTREGMESWMVGKTDFELTVGAMFRTSYDKKSTLDDDNTIHQQLLAYDPGRMITLRTVRPPKGFPFPNAIGHTWTVVYFESAGPTQTRVTAKMFGFSAAGESQKMRAFFERGNRATLDSLIKRFTKP